MLGSSDYQGFQSSVADILSSLEGIDSQWDFIANPDRGAGSRRKVSGHDSADGGVITKATFIDDLPSDDDDWISPERAQARNTLARQLQRTRDDATFLVETVSYCKRLQGENEKLKAQVVRLSGENHWLRDELNDCMEKLKASEVNVVELTEQRDHYQYLANALQIDDKESLFTTSVTLPAVSVPDGGPMVDNGDEEQPDEQTSIDAIGDTAMPTHSTSSTSSVSDQLQVPQRLRTLHNLVIQYASQGRYEVAVPLCKQALDDIERSQGKEHPDCATMLNILAMVYRDQNKFKEASRLLLDALRIREKALGVEHPAVAATLNNLAVLYGKQGKFSEAEPLCKRALAIREKVLGSKHPDVAKQLNNLALICQNQSKFEEVESYYKRALDIYKTVLGPADVNVAKTMNNLASCYVKQGKYKAAEGLYRSVLETAHSKEFGPGIPEATQSSQASRNKAARLTGQNNVEIKKNKASLQSAYAEYGGWHRAVGTDSPTVQTTLKNLGALYRRQGKMDVADTIDEVSIRSRKKALDVVKKSKVVEVLGTEAAASGVVGPNVPAPSPDEQQRSRGRSRANSFTSSSSGGKQRSNSVTSGDRDELDGTPKSSLKRRGSFSKLKGSVGRAISKVVGDSKDKRSRSSSVPRSMSSASSEEHLNNTADNQASSPSSPSPSSAAGSSASPTPPILANPTPLQTPNASSHGSSRRHGRGPLKAPHSKAK